MDFDLLVTIGRPPPAVCTAWSEGAAGEPERRRGAIGALPEWSAPAPAGR